MELEKFKQLCEEIKENFKDKIDKLSYSIDKLIEILENDPRLKVKHMKKDDCFRVEFAPKEFHKKYNREETNKGWALYNEIKKIWENSTDKPFNSVKISVLENYVEIRK